ncbi:hypothetical protein KDC22_22240 [Paenibacillus tritici]|uniref:hypothetical protein n=1 Tax=Paenibacillus tritici TaxID=1873425 RepID=UPI001BA89C23|nr:hypothetical protein [Paenibacillus tritici]QUL53128.1 hypothetical protein KDC22_22240 [Paenibacillus tritici]
MTILSALPLVRIAEIRVESAPELAVTFTSLASLVPAGTRHLVVEVNAAQTYTERRFCEVILNGDTASHYNRREFTAAGSAVTTVSTTNINAAQGVDVPPASAGYGGGYLLFPFAFRTDNLKLWQTMGSSLETRLQRHSGAWESTAAISSITLRPWQNVPGGVNQWAAGSIVTLYAVDEARLAADRLPDERSKKFTFGTLPSDANHLLLLMHLRSSQNLVTRQGDRVYQQLNNDTVSANYPIQRLGGEGIADNKIIDEFFTEKRVGWSTAAAAPADSFGNLVVMYPEYRSTVFHKPWMSQHAEFEEVFYPVSQENGRRRNTDALNHLHYFPGIGGEYYLPGSIISAYKSEVPAARHVVSASGEASVTLQVPAGAVGLRAVAVARTNGAGKEDRLLMELNGDASAASYAVRRASASEHTHETALQSDNEIGVIPGGEAEAGQYGCGALAIVRHADTDRHKHILSLIGASGGRLALYGGRWKNNAAVTSVTFKPKNGTLFAAGSVFELLVAGDAL